MNLRIAIAVGVLCSASLALADADTEFRDFVSKEAQENQQYVESWWSANLDTDPDLEHVAVLCPNEKEDHKGYFLIEKDKTHRWEITFDFDSRTKACKGKPAAPPKLEQRKSGTVDLYQGHLQGYELTAYAIRVGQPVIVRDEILEKEGGKPEIKDWDALIKKKKVKNYQSPDGLRQLNN
jgi:hypothetical protein